MNIETIRAMLREEQVAGYTPRQAVSVVMDRIGRQQRETLEALLLHEARDIEWGVDAERRRREQREQHEQARREQLERPCGICETTGHRELFPVEPGTHYTTYGPSRPYPRAAGTWMERVGWFEVSDSSPLAVCCRCRDSLPGDTRTRQRYEYKETANRVRAEHGLPPLVWHEDELMLPDERDRLLRNRAEQAALRRQEREERQAREAARKAELKIKREQEFCETAAEMGIKIPAGGSEQLREDNETAWEMVWTRALWRPVEQAFYEGAERLARERYGEKIWTGVEWVAIGEATKRALLACADWHDAEATIHEDEARQHRAEAKRMRELAMAVPEGRTVADIAAGALPTAA